VASVVASPSSTREKYGDAACDEGIQYGVGAELGFDGLVTVGSHEGR
jgi:hypothetical protein